MTASLMVALITPEEAKTAGIVVVMVTACLAALLLPLAQAFARRIDPGRATNEMRQQLADVTAQLDELRRGQDRVAELEARLDFAERLLVQQRDGEMVEKRGQLGAGGGGS